MNTFANGRIVGLLLLVGVCRVQCAEPTLKIGDAAPQLQTGRWVQGEPVTSFEKGKAYIIEFWATWCGPCLELIPHLNDTYLKYKDKGVIVIGMDCWENDDKLVVPFVEKMGSNMMYRVALDDKNVSKQGKMAETWMDAAGQDAIPMAFVVDTNGVIAWVANPIFLNEEVVEYALAGEFDAVRVVAQYIAFRQNEPGVENAGVELITALKAKAWDSATKHLTALQKLLPEEERYQLDLVRVGISFGKQDYPTAYKLALEMSDAHKEDVNFQNWIAWEIAANPRLELRDMSLAETAATRANEASGGDSQYVLDTLARVLFMRGKKDEAIAAETKAVKLADGVFKYHVQKSLESYKSGELPKID